MLLVAEFASPATAGAPMFHAERRKSGNVPKRITINKLDKLVVNNPSTSTVTKTATARITIITPIKITQTQATISEMPPTVTEAPVTVTETATVRFHESASPTAAQSSGEYDEAPSGIFWSILTGLVGVVKALLYAVKVGYYITVFLVFVVAPVAIFCPGALEAPAPREKQTGEKSRMGEEDKADREASGVDVDDHDAGDDGFEMI